jgi:hypothetical protein
MRLCLSLRNSDTPLVSQLFPNKDLTGSSDSQNGLNTFVIAFSIASSVSQTALDTSRFTGSQSFSIGLSSGEPSQELGGGETRYWDNEGG